MKATITHTVEVPNIQKATSLRDSIAESLSQELGVQVIHSGLAKDSVTYKVMGYDTKGQAAFEQEVEAQDPVEAQHLVESTDMKVVKVEEAE